MGDNELHRSTRREFIVSGSAAAVDAGRDGSTRLR
jgi:hypothetical protein